MHFRAILYRNKKRRSNIFRSVLIRYHQDKLHCPTFLQLFLLESLKYAFSRLVFSSDFKNITRNSLSHLGLFLHYFLIIYQNAIKMYQNKPKNNSSKHFLPKEINKKKQFLNVVFYDALFCLHESSHSNSLPLFEYSTSLCTDFPSLKCPDGSVHLVVR